MKELAANLFESTRS